MGISAILDTQVLATSGADGDVLTRQADGTYLAETPSALLIGNNLSDLLDASTARANLAVLPIADPTFTGEIGVGAVNVSETELGILEGATLTTTELNYVDGVTSSIQDQLDAAGGSPGGSTGQIQYNNASAFGGTVALVYAASGTHFAVTAQTATYVPVVVKGAASQTANLQEWQNSAGTVLTAITASGRLEFAGTASVYYVSGWLDCHGFRISSSKVEFTQITLTGKGASVSLLSSVLSSGWGDGAPITIAPSEGSTASASIGNAKNGGNLTLQAGLGNAASGSGGHVYVTAGSGGASTYGVGTGAMGGNIVISAGKTAGDAVPATITFQTSSAGSSGGGVQSWTETLQLDASATAADTRMLLWDVDSAALKRIVNNGSILQMSGVATGTTLSASGPTVVPITIKAAASQTANLQDWQDSAGTVLTAITKDGVLSLPQGNATTPSIKMGESNDGIAISAASAFMNFILNGTTRLLFGANSMRFSGYGTKAAPSYSWIDLPNAGMYVNTLGVNSPVAIAHVGNLMAEFNRYRGNSFFAIASNYPCVIVNANASQTVNVQQWVDGAGVVGLAVGSNANDLVLNATTGTKFGTAATQKLSMWGATPIVQPTTAIADAAFNSNMSGMMDGSATFGGYTVGQIVTALKNIGALA